MSLIVVGGALLALGITVALRALLLMYDRATTTRVWMLREFGAGVCLAGWGVVFVLPSQARRIGMAVMGVGTVGVLVAVLLLGQAMPA